VRIVYVLTSLGMGGAERQVLALAQRMADRGHSVLLVVLRPRLAEEWPTKLDVLYLNMRKKPLSLIQGLIQARRSLNDFQPDLIHSHTYPGNMAARLLKIFSPRTALISTIHNVFEGGWIRMLAYRLSDPLSCLTTAVSSAAAERYIQMKALSRSKCRVVVNGIDLGGFVPDTERRAQTRSAMNAENNFIWLTAGRIAKAKDYPNLLRAFAIAQTNFSSTQLWVAGEGEAAEIAAMRALAQELGLTPQVRWLGLRRDMPALLDAADGFVLGSAWEGMPLAVGEAMAMAKPVAATDVGGVRELVGDAGRIVPAKDPRQLSLAMIELMNSSMATRQSLGHAARDRIANQFNMDAKTLEWEALYRSVLKSTSTSN
jgi:glycosyltransferase involved in cell wall biosynthesis